MFNLSFSLDNNVIKLSLLDNGIVQITTDVIYQFYTFITIQISAAVYIN